MPELPSNPSAAFKKRNPHLFPEPNSASLRLCGEQSVSIPAHTNLVLKQSTDEQKLNKLEKAWLGVLRLEYPTVRIQQLQLKIGDDCRYCPDFYVIDANGQLVFHEVKGFMRDDALVKLKTAARTYREFRFVLVRRKQGQWIETPIAP